MFVLSASAGASTVPSDQLGSWIGILATGALVFALAPLRRVAEKLADQAMPSVRDTPEYRNLCKLQIYGEALQDALRDGELSPVQRVVLNLRTQLELTQAEAETFERDIDGSRDRVTRQTAGGKARYARPADPEYAARTAAKR